MHVPKPGDPGGRWRCPCVCPWPFPDTTPGGSPGGPTPVRVGPPPVPAGTSTARQVVPSCSSPETGTAPPGLQASWPPGFYGRTTSLTLVSLTVC